jgi:hypothetical protein
LSQPNLYKNPSTPSLEIARIGFAKSELTSFEPSAGTLPSGMKIAIVSGWGCRTATTSSIQPASLSVIEKPLLDAGDSAFEKMKSRVPDQRTEAEYLDAVRAQRLRQQVLELGFTPLGGHQSDLGPKQGPIRGMKPAIKITFAGQLRCTHRATILSRAAPWSDKKLRAD